jgi:glycosyltransferase involved in cell wall biosynthesis
MAMVSVVVPCYRHESYVADCLESVCAQSYGDMELIVLDDCSPDSTYKIVKELCASKVYKARFRKITCLRNETNLGAHVTINRGVQLSEGEYITILNSDDQYHHERISALMLACSEQDSQLAFSNYVFIDETNQEVWSHPLYLELQTQIRESQMFYPSMGFAFLRKQLALSTGNLLFVRKLYETIGGFADLKFCHDWDFILQAIRVSEPIFIDEPYYRYRIHGTNSFSTLGDVAGAETEFLLRRYFSVSESMGTPNGLAPSSRNWPGVFEVEIERFELTHYYKRAVSGCLPWHRTIDI